MYPFLRLAIELWQNRRAPEIALGECHSTQHTVWPWDMDFFCELNNGRTLTLYDLNRMGLAQRSGILTMLKRQGWGMTVAGSSVRYRRRVRAFHRVEMRGRGIGLDDKFMYVEQSIWRKGECCSHILLRIAVTNAAGIVPSAQVIEALGTGMELNALPDWVTSWSAAEAKRPWPPMGPAMEPPVQPQMDKIDAPV